MQKKQIAIIGAGISGLSCAYHLADDFEVTVFEKESYPGGHTDTHELKIDGKTVYIDSGFIIFCPEFYPNFQRMLQQLRIEKQVTQMSFSVFNKSKNLLYNATSVNKLFCQRRNLLRPAFYRMLIDIVRFYKVAPRVLQQQDELTTVQQYLSKHNYSSEFAEDHLLPMISALWSATPKDVLEFPIRHLVDFFSRHGLMQLFNRPPWYVIKNGSRTYVDALRQSLPVTWHCGSEVRTVRRGDRVTVVSADSTEHEFDAVVFAAHADQTLRMLEMPSSDEEAVLGAMRFQENHVLVHTDTSVMPPNKNAWASWNTQVPKVDEADGSQICTANYWMNSLQNLDLQTAVFTSLNSASKIDPAKVLKERVYSHPVFTPASVAAQKNKHRLDGVNNSYFVGAYWGWGFHEDGARTAAQVSDLIKEQLR